MSFSEKRTMSKMKEVSNVDKASVEKIRIR